MAEPVPPGTVGLSDEPTDYERLVRFVNRPPDRFGIALARSANMSVCEAILSRAFADATSSGVRVELVDFAGAEPNVDIAGRLAAAVRSRDSVDPKPVLFVSGLNHLLTTTTGEPALVRRSIG